MHYKQQKQGIAFKISLACISLLSIQNVLVSGCRRGGGGGGGGGGCSKQNCWVGSYSSWSGCSHRCGSTGVQTKTRSKIRTEKCGGACPYSLRKTKPCNRDNCRNWGRSIPGRCSCISGFTGTCCEYDVNECLQYPCQHICENTEGSYKCGCYSPCYTKRGRNCQLQRCMIGGECFEYGDINPYNQCQDCQRFRKTAWTNNNKLSCSDKNLCTRNDHCVNGVCKGTPFTCLDCESCDGSGCIINPGFCVIAGKCYKHGDLRSGKPCQQCNSNRPRTWTANNNLACSDNDVKTRNDRCSDGECRGEPFTCLPCQDHHNDTCRAKTGYCVINFNNVDTCYTANTNKPRNMCQWCLPSASTSTWTMKHDVPCNDKDSCTKLDQCKNGQCKGISFSCNNDCQSCNDTDCSLHTGYGYVAGKCTCKVADENYQHQQLNPNNECQWCDIYDKSSKLSSAWSNRPASNCSDGNDCTKQDICNSGYCVGIQYSCQSSFPQSSCIQRSQCNGDGTCKNIMKKNGTICRAATDQCDQPERCDGVLGTCPPSSVTEIAIRNGQARVTLHNFATPVSFQSSTNKLYLQLSGFSATCGSLTVQWSLIKADKSCDLDNNSTLSTNVNTRILGGLNLLNAETYKVVVQVYNVRHEFGLPVCSNPVTIDTSTPTGGWVLDGLGSIDLQFQSSLTFSATWGGFQAIHGIAKYEVAMQYQPLSSNNQSEVQAFMNVNLNVSLSKTISVIPDGSKVTTKVRAFTKAGLYSEMSSNGVTVDTSEPFSGSVSDGWNILQDLQYADWRSSYALSWETFTDPHTPIVNYNVGVKKKHSGFLSSGLTPVGLRQTFLFAHLTLFSEEEYCAIVEGENAAGLKTRVSSNCLLIDHDPPRQGTVNDGISDDIDYQSDDTVFYGNWNEFDDGIRGSGIEEYRYILTDQNGKNITSWTGIGLQTNVTIKEIKLVDGYTYYITVRAIDRVGHYKDVKSDGVYIDTTHPVYTGKIRVHGESAQKDGVSVVYIANHGTLTASWPQFVDKHSGMKKYQWSIFENHTRPSEWNDVPGVNLSTNAMFRSLSLANNTAYRLIIRGGNNADLHADILSSVIIPIGGAPKLGTASDGRDPLLDIDYVTNTSELHATWQGFETADVKVRAYFFAVGSCTRGNYHVTNNQFMPVIPPTANSYAIHGLHLVNGQRYCIKIKAENLAGVESSVASSDGFVVDVSPPDLKSAMVLDGLGEDDIDHQSNTMELSATWTGIRDHESGIQHFEVAVSRSRAGQPNITSFINVNFNMSSTISGLRLNNEVYYFILCAINNAGIKSCLTSDGVLIDPTPPTTGIVHDGILEPDIRYQASMKEISANWERVWDLESRVERFEWGISEEGKGLVQDFTNVGLQTHVTSNKVLNLKHGHNYTVSLRVYNRAGVVQGLSSNGVIIDTTPPVPSEIKPLPSRLEWRFSEETGTYYSSSATDIYVTWENFQELESEMWYYKIAIGTSKYGTQLQSLTNIGLATNANTSGIGLNIRPGIRYFVTVVGRNRANLVSGNCSWPFLLDFSPPQTGKMQIKSNSGLAKEYYRLGEIIRVGWSGFQDPESQIEKYEISVIHNSSAILNYGLKSSQTESEIFIDTSLLYPGKSFSIVLKSINYAGLESIVVSTAITIDDTPPAYTGKRDELPMRYFRSNTHPFQISWDAFEDYESPVKYYEVGIGRRNSGDDILKFTNTDLCTQFSAVGLKIEKNQVYYVTVKAFNRAGLSSSLLLEEINLDHSPPTGGIVRDGVSSEDVDFMSLQDTFSASLEDIKDVESGIQEIEYCVGSTPFNCFIKPFTSIFKNKSFTCSDCKVDAGMTAFAVFRVTNTANLSAIFVSDGLTVDSTPPEIQLVYDGEKAKYPDVEKSQSNWTPTVTWYGARDVQSGLRNCKWTILKKEGNSTLSLYVRTLQKSNITYNSQHVEKATVQLTTNSSYLNVIQCWNNAGLSSQQYSNGWSVVEQWPIPSYVIDGTGSHDMEYDINGETLGASWGAFHADSKDPIIKYEWAVGTLGEVDNILEFIDVVLVTKVSLSLSESDVSAKPGVKYYTTVRGTTLSGWSSNKTSNGFIIDTTPPTAGSVSVTHRILNQKNNDVDYTISWQGFTDSESGIQNYAYCLGYIRDVCSTAVSNADLAFTGTVHGFLPGAQENSFFGIIIVTNKAGLKTIASSSDIKIDFTPPVTGTVFDGIDNDLDYINSSVALATSWSAFTEAESGIKKCILTVSEEYASGNESFTLKFKMEVNASGSVVHDLPLISGLRYVSRIACENHDGFESSKSSNGVIVDDTPPTVGKILDKNGQSFAHQYQASTSELHVRWTDGYDRESGIMEYLIAVGTGSSEANIHEFFSVGLVREINVKNLTMNSGSTYYITLQVVNKAGISSRVSSNGITVDTTPPKIQQVKLQNSETGYISSSDNLIGNWKTFDDESDIDFVEYCFGTIREGCNVQEMRRAFEKEMNVTCLDCKLHHKHTYYMTVRIWNKAGLFSLDTPEGVVADLTAPVGGKVSLNKTHMSCVGHCSLAVGFSGFEDEESGIGGCEFSIITEDQTTVMPVQPTTSQNEIEVNYLTLHHGESYKVIVACDNIVGQRSLEVFSPPIRIDNTPPEKGFVIISPDRNHDVRRRHVGCHFINTTLRIYWSQFYDKESNIAGFRVTIGRKPRGSDVIPYTYFGVTSEARFHLHENYGLSLGETVFATVEATNKAGLSSEVTSPVTRLISVTDNNLVNEQDFLCVNF